MPCWMLASPCRSSCHGPHGGLPYRSRTPSSGHSRPCSIHGTQWIQQIRQAAGNKNTLRPHVAAWAGTAAPSLVSVQQKPVASLQQGSIDPSLSLGPTTSEQPSSADHAPPSSSLQNGSGTTSPSSSSSSSKSSSSTELTETELARRQKIGKANAGKVPWNKGRKHSPGGRYPHRNNLQMGQASSCKPLLSIASYTASYTIADVTNWVCQSQAGDWRA